MELSESLGYGDDPKYHTRFKVTECKSVGDLCALMVRNFWSSILWKDNYRRSDNFIKSSLIVLDFDDGQWTIERATDEFSKLGLMHIIGTTRSHCQEKHRFRAVIPLQNPITNPIQYRQNIEKLCRVMPADPACKDTARMFRKCKEILVVKQGQYIIPAPLDPFVPRIIKYEKGSIPDFINTMLNELPEHGNRNKHCFRIAAKLSELGHSEQTCIDYVLKAIVDLPESEKIMAAKSGYRFGCRKN